MTDSVPLPRDQFFVAVAGAMNPLIHHPQWYRNIGAIDEAELQDSLKMPTNSTTPFGSQVQFGSPALSIACQQNQWSIRATDQGSWGRMLKITSLVFEKLNETPVTAYGLLAHRHLPTEASDVKAVIAATLAGLEFGFPLGKSMGSTLNLTVTDEDFQIIATIQPSVLSESDVFGSYHHNHPVPTSPSGYFDLGALLNARFERFQLESGKFFANIVAAVNARAARKEAS